MNRRVLAVACGLFIFVGCDEGGKGPSGASDSGADTGAVDAFGGHVDAEVADAGPVDECADGIADCDLNADCTDTLIGFECTCRTGFEGDGRTCTDIDECTTDNGGCAQTCANEAGSFTCGCGDGYTLNADGAACDDIDECATDNGGCAQTCANDVGGFTCSCVDGYILNPDGLRCDDVDECLMDFGGCAQNCTNEEGTYACSCVAGYTLNADGFGCDDVDECATDNGDCDQTCINDVGSFACACEVGYTLNVDGLGCDDVNECRVLNGGCDQNCVNAEGTFACTCNDGWALANDGRGCTDVDECGAAIDNCSDDARCANIDGSFTCECLPGFFGDGVTCIDVDECADGLDDCAGNAGCTNTHGGFTCACDEGWFGDGVDCIDIHECAEGIDNCSDNGTCTNTDGSFTCECNDGFTGDGVACADVDECQGELDDCSDNATCTNTIGGFTCACNDGWFGDGVSCDNVDECADGVDNCSDNATCTNTDGSFTCECNGGFAGDGVDCADIDECQGELDDCSDNATCTNTIGGFTCACNDGWFGDGVSCDNVDECADGVDNCSDNATCTNTDGSFTCACNEGFTGDGVACGDVDECQGDLDDCSDNATCTNTIGGFTCACNDGWFGDGVSCDNVDECAQGVDNCSDDATCTNTDGSFTCECNGGFVGDGVNCVDIDECADGADNCSEQATCTNTPGSFSCACNDGWVGDGVACADVDECADGVDNCSDNATCANTDGGFTCACEAGFLGDGVTCDDIDECADGVDNCSEQATCTNTPGFFVCDCDSGWAGDGVDCVDIDPCLAGTDNCSDDALCTNTDGGFRCECNGGFVGDGVDCADVDECADGADNCSEEATCDNIPGRFICACNPGWSGDGVACADVDECADGVDNCSDNATCTNIDGSFTCACNDGFAGDGVDCVDVDECQDELDDCSDNATCTNTIGGFTCACNDGWFGDGVSCDNVDECADGVDNCSDNATCTNTDGSFTCECNGGFVGDGVDCADVDECQGDLDDCSDNATCTNTIGGFTCACNDGWFGDGVSCDNVDECADGVDNCSDDATCTNTDGGFTCACNPGFAGDGVDCADVDECTDGLDNCSDNATCTNTPGRFTCACNPGWSGNGLDCADVDECADGIDNCSDDATCTNTDGGFTCACNAGFAGDGVDCADVDECDLGLADCAGPIQCGGGGGGGGGGFCGEISTCTNTIGAFECSCNAGWVGDGTVCADENECDAGDDDCSDNARCVNTQGSFQCACNQGFEGDGVQCADIDECARALDNCGDGEVCTNTVGGFDCGCAPMFFWDGAECVDVDECQLGLDNCDRNAVCTNLPGGFTCECEDGFLGDGVDCEDIDECAVDNGGCGDPESVVCTNTPGSFSCNGLHYYICDCDEGADPDCVAGDDANWGVSPDAPWRTVAKAYGKLNERLADPLLAGGSLRFCQGGVLHIGDAGDLPLRSANCQAYADEKCAIMDYAPPWRSGDEGRPVLYQTDDNHGINLGDAGSPDPDGGYVIQNLELRSTTGNGFGVWVHNDVDDVTIDNMLIHGFAIGLHSSGSNECRNDNPGCDRDNEAITLRNSTITDNTAQGFLGWADNLLLENNLFEFNGAPSDRDHNIYISGIPYTEGREFSVGIRIIGNTLHGSAVDENGVCHGVSLVGHGKLQDVLIEDNLIYEHAARGGCWGIGIDPGYGDAEELRNVIIRGNRVYNTGNTSIAVGSCIDCIIENNVVVNEHENFGLHGIGLGNPPRDGDAQTENLMIRNNSVYLNSINIGFGIYLSGGEGDGYAILNNAIELLGPAPDIGANQRACLNVENINELTVADHNVCHHQPGAFAGWYAWGNTHLSLDQWRQQTGFGANSVYASPEFVSTTGPDYDLRPDALSSPLIDAGHPALSAPNDILGIVRGAAPDVGAYEGTDPCGDGVVGDGEECDDANTSDQDGCTRECRCAAGFELNGELCVDVDECVMGFDDCAEMAACVNQPGGFDCECPQGFGGDGRDCQDIDECQILNGGCAQLCVNDVGSFSCSCQEGFVLNADEVSCDDINECDAQACGGDVVCVNLPGTFECRCDPGFEHFIDRCMEVDECLMGRDDCAEGASCTNTVGSFECECLPGYLGDGRVCLDSDECADGLDNCQAPSVCRNTPGAWSCDCPDGLIPHEGGCITPAVCDAPTNWGQIAASLADYAAQGMLPDVPAEALAVDWGSPSFFREDVIKGDPEAEGVAWDHQRCDGPTTWPADRIQLGSVGESEDHRFNHWEAGEPYCRIQPDAQAGGTLNLDFMHRGGGSYAFLNSVRLSGEPNWVRLRFPIPPGHRATQFTYTLKRAALTGSHPQHCSDGLEQCARQQIADDEDWDEVVPPGLFLLWARPGDCDGWLITGPHSPGLKYDQTNYEIDVPTPFQDADELVVSMLVYHQYPGCDGPPCVEGAGDCQQNCVTEDRTHRIMELVKATLRTEGTLGLNMNVPEARPRLFGDDAQWLADNALFDAIDCVGGQPQWGGVPDVRGVWSQRTLGANVCNGEAVPASVDDHPYAAMYRDGTLDEARYRGRGWNWGGPAGHRTIGLVTMHMLRRELACHRAAAGGCQFEIDDLNAFIDDFIDLELSRFGLWVWHGYGEGFDINSAAAFIFWTTFVDVLSDRLTDEQLALVSHPMSVGIDNYLRLYRERHWHIFNGNNWTNTLSRTALHWAITYWYEDERAARVADIAIKTMWLHRDFYLSDGVYVEGTNYVSFNSTNLQIIDRMVWTTFGVHLDSVRWPYLEKTGEWLIEQMLSDGRKVDFADAWPKGGFASIEPLTLMLATEMVGGDPGEIDPCLARRFFVNYVFEGGLENPWFVPPIMASRDWHAVVADCGAEAGAEPEVKVWPEGGYGLIRTRQAGATQTGQIPPDGDRAVGRYEQADDTLVVISALPNGKPHTELDFASIIWVAYGQRLLTDMGYGTIGSSGSLFGGGHHRYNTGPDHAPDNNPTGHNTLVVREAVHPNAENPDSTNVSQINGERGTVERRSLNGTAFVEVDGSDVYGATDPIAGGQVGFDLDNYVPPRWLQGFKRAIIPIPGGDFILADMFRVREDQDDATVEEYWHVRQMIEPPDADACKYNKKHVDLDLIAPDTIRLRPRCSALLAGNGHGAESVGRITGAGMRPGQFVVAEDQIIFTNRINGTDVFRRARWVPDAVASDGVRVFVLNAAPSEDRLPAASVTPRACGEDTCFDVQVDGDTYTLTFSDEPQNWALTDLEGWPDGE